MKENPLQRNAKAGGFSKLIINLATAAVALSVMVMLLAVAIVKGYQHEVRDKLVGFNAPVQITHLDMNNSYESLPIERDTIMEDIIRKREGVKFINLYASKAGIIKTDSSFQGLVLKGVSQDYKFDFIKKYLQEGRLPNFQDSSAAQEILISANTARKLKLHLDQDLFIYFIQEPPRVRRLKICGIYDTGMGELDELYAFTDIRHIQKLNNWHSQQISGYEIGLSNIDATLDMKYELSHLVPFTMGLSTVFDLYPALFDWLGLLDMNVFIILGLMVTVAVINMITALLILILERTRMIGVLKALGAADRQVSHIFLWMAGRIIFRGLLLGNSVGLVLAGLQEKFGWVKLDQKSYYINRVPVEIHVTDIVWINLLSLAVCMFILLIPVRLVSKVSPARTLQFQ